jgi:hypothetical protein
MPIHWKFFLKQWCILVHSGRSGVNHVVSAAYLRLDIYACSETVSKKWLIYLNTHASFSNKNTPSAVITFHFALV